MKLVSVEQMKIIEEAASRNGISYATMMQNAGERLAEVVHSRFYDATRGVNSVLGLVGSGNNGGDTLIALRSLREKGWHVKAYLVRPREEGDELLIRLKDLEIEIIQLAEDARYHHLEEVLKTVDVVLDGILGTGVKLPLKPDISKLLGYVKSYRRKPIMVAVDCPSGVDCDTGDAADTCIPVDLTVCMAAVKKGLLRLPAYHLAGELVTVDIDLPADLPEWKGINRWVVTKEWVERIIPRRKADAHKGTYGTALIAAGSVNYTGAVMLSAKAAYRVGVGLVQAAIPGPLYAALAGQIPEATWILLPHETGVIAESAADVLRENLKKIDALLIGPGLGMEETTGGFVKRLFSQEKGRKASLGFLVNSADNPKEELASKLPALVLDADALKLLAKWQKWTDHVPVGSVLTPHPGEMAVMTGLSIDEIQRNRVEIAETYAKQWRQVIVLKGAFTVIADPDGQVAMIPVATAALAKAGTGDVLAGMIVGLLAQGVSPFEAATAGCWIHAQAGLIAAKRFQGTASVLAGEVADAIPEVLASLQLG